MGLGVKRIVLGIALTTFIHLPAHAKGQLVATPMNSPVKESHLVVKLDGESDIAKVYFKPKTGGQEIEGELIKESNGFVGKLKVSNLKPGEYDYRIRVRSSSGNSSQNEAASVSMISFKIDESLEVADPGEEGKKTLLGIDSDNDGIRDDVQRYLNEKYSNKLNVKSALQQHSKAFQEIFSSVNNKSENLIAIRKSLDSLSCLVGIETSATAAFPRIKELESYIVNTQERLVANKKAQLNFSGQSIQVSENKLSKCKFEIK